MEEQRSIPLTCMSLRLRCHHSRPRPPTSHQTAAVALQRDLIEAWACELIREFQTDRKVLTRGDRNAPMKLAWIFRKGPLQFSWPEGCINEVPADMRVDDSLRCGFLGSQCRSVKGEKGGFRFVPIDLG